MKIILSFSDLQYCPERKEQCFKILQFIHDKAVEIRPDFITISGDLQERLISNCLKHDLVGLKLKLDELSEIAEIFMIYGTPSHDPPGSLEIFESERIHIVRPGMPWIHSDKKVIFYGLPEPTKQYLIDKNIDAAGMDLNQAMKNLCMSYGAHRKEYPDYKAVVLGHGNVRCSNTEKEEAIKRATVCFTEDDLACIDANIYIFGHIHKPYNFNKVFGFYCGSFAWDWKECGYKPHIMECQLSGPHISINEHQIPFIPERIKITSFKPKGGLMLENEFDIEQQFNNKMIWLELPESEKNSDLLDMLIESGAHKNSRVTYIRETKEIVRSAKIQTLLRYRDMFNEWKYPSATEIELQACDEIQENDVKSGVICEPTTIEMVSTNVRGFKPFHEGMGRDQLLINWQDYEGLVGLIGPGGIGKSTLFDITSPFTESFTQPNSLLSMFYLNDSFIINKYRVNGKIIEEKILIKPLGKRPTAEYYIYIDGVPVDECNKNLSPFNEFVYRTFGTPPAYAATVFQTQFGDNLSLWKGIRINPNFGNADNATLKNLVYTLAGIDKENAFNYSKDKKKHIESLQMRNESEIIALTGMISDPSVLEMTRKNHIIAYDIFAEFIKNKQLEIADKELIYNDLLKMEKESDTAQKLIDSHNQTIHFKENQIKDIEKLIAENKNIPEQIENYNKIIAALKIELQQEDEKKKENDKKEDEYRNAFDDYHGKVLEYQVIIEEISNIKSKLKIKADGKKTEILNHKKMIETLIDKINLLNDPCPKCGFIRNTNEIKAAEKVIESYKEEINKFEKEVNTLRIQYQIENDRLKEITKPIEPQKPELLKLGAPVQLKIDHAITQLNTLNILQTKIKGSALQIENFENDIINLQSEIEKNKTNIIPQISDKVDTANNDIKLCRQELSEAQTELTKAESEIAQIEKELKEIETQKDKLEKLQLQKTELQIQFEIWSTMCQAWGRDGIPAMMLDNVAVEINARANELLDKYYPGLHVEMVTVRESADRKKQIEDFSINVINTQTGCIKPVNCISGQERNFVFYILRKAFDSINAENSLRKYMWNCLDEPDSHVGEDYIDAMWEMIKDTNDPDKLTICTSHSPAGKSIFDLRQVIEIENI